jgi:hypothetical protein
VGEAADSKGGDRWMSTSPSGYRVSPAVETGGSDKVRRLLELWLRCTCSNATYHLDSHNSSGDIPPRFPQGDPLTVRTGCGLLSTQGAPKRLNSFSTKLATSVCPRKSALVNELVFRWLESRVSGIRDNKAMLHRRGAVATNEPEWVQTAITE